MDERIAVITTSGVVAQQAARLFAEKGIAYPLIHTQFSTIISEAQQAVARGAKVFVSRGKSARMLMEHFDLPVVTLRFTYYDFATAIRQAQQYSNRIAIVGYADSWYHPLEQYRHQLANPRTLYLDSPGELDDALRSLAGEGVVVVIGGQTAVNASKKFGLQAVRIGLEESSILDSLEQARHILKIELQRSEHIATVDAILNSTSEGVVAVDGGGTITKINASAKAVLGEGCAGRPLLERMDSPVVRSALENRTAIRNELVDIGGTQCSVSSSPVRAEGEWGGIVFTVQPVKMVHSLDQSIRGKQSRCGNTAKATFGDIIGASAAMRSTVEKAKLYAASDGTVLIGGETGTGKEMFAQSIHNYSKRSRGPFVAINCAALPQSILESELFGYVKGAFTGASSSGKTGYFEAAHTGTLFLDEIGEMPLDMQIKLLRVLQERELRRVGDHKVFQVDVRVIAASNQDLRVMVKKGQFREDLFYRLAVLELYIPPLRQRKEDIIPIADTMFREIARRDGAPVKRLTAEAERALAAPNWLGNVRQLRNVVERVSVICPGAVVDLHILQEAINAGRRMSDHGRIPSKTHPTVPKGEKAAILEALKAERGNRERAACRLGMSKTTLWRRITRIRDEDAGFLADLYFPPAGDHWQEPVPPGPPEHSNR